MDFFASCGKPKIPHLTAADVLEPVNLLLSHPSAWDRAPSYLPHSASTDHSQKDQHLNEVQHWDNINSLFHLSTSSVCFKDLHSD